MLNLKWGIFSGLVALVLAFAISLLFGRADLTIAALRALSFAVLFFLLGTGAWVLINSYIPELLFPEAHKDPIGSVFSVESSVPRVNITVGDTSGAALPEQNGDNHSINDVENIADLVSGKFKPTTQHIDQNSPSSYNDEAGEFTPAPDIFAASNDGEGAGSIDFNSFVSGGSEMADLGMDSFSFGSDSESKEEPVNPFAPERKVSGNKPVEFEGDFSPKEIAAGLRTVLEQDKKG